VAAVNKAAVAAANTVLFEFIAKRSIFHSTQNHSRPQHSSPQICKGSTMCGEIWRAHNKWNSDNCCVIDSRNLPSRHDLAVRAQQSAAVKIIYICSNNQAPPAMKMPPAIRETNLPNGNTFSNKTNPASSAIHSTFMTPPTNSSSIRAQQQPMQ
jgi:hypothetical protein